MSQFLWSQSPGDLDPSFSTDGWLIENGGTDAEYSAVATLPDGRIVAAGMYDLFNARNIWVCRWWPNGTLDTGFDGDGISMVTGYAVESDQVDLDVQPDGKVLVTSYVTDNNGDYGLVARFDTSGALDPSFGQGGVVLDPTSSVAEGFDKIHVQSNGRILVTGAGSGVLSITAFTSTGSRDNSYGPFNGQVVLPMSSVDDINLEDSGLMSSGELTLMAEGNTGGVRSLHLLRVDEDGDLVTGFGFGGIVSVADTFWSYPSGFAVANTGEVYVAGIPPTWAGNLPVMVRKYTATGVLDNSWGQSGAALAQSSGHLHCWAMVVASDGKLYISGDYDAGPTDIMLARFTTTGQLDGAFGNGGVATDLTAGGMIWANDVVEQPDGKIVVAGIQNNVSNASGFMARFLTSPVTDIESNPEDLPFIQIAPNPAAEYATLRWETELDGQLDIAICDLTGKICAELGMGAAQPGRHSEIALPVAGLPSGVYLVRLLANGKQYNQRLVVTH